MLQSHFKFPGQTAFYKGKVRDVYTIEDRLMVMVVSDRISAFDVVLPRPIPYKGQVLNQIAARMLAATADIVPNWVRDVPLPQVTIGEKCEAFPVEMVVRGNLTGHAWRTYKSGKRSLCGVPLPEGMKENDFFPAPIITPTTKAHEGHDEDISREQIISEGLISEQDYAQLEKYTLALFERGRELAKKQGLILVDTKYEFGKSGDVVYLIDEVHTPRFLPLFLRRHLRGEPAGRPSAAPAEQGVRKGMAHGARLPGEGRTAGPRDERCLCPERQRQVYRTVRAHYRQEVRQGGCDRKRDRRKDHRSAEAALTPFPV